MNNVSVDFFYISGYCSSDGCPEYYFDHKIKFTDEYGTKAFMKAKEIVERSLVNKSASLVEKYAVFKDEEELSAFLSGIKKIYSDAHKDISLFSCKHGNILFDKTVRFNIDKQKISDLEKNIEENLPKISHSQIQLAVKYRLYIL